MKLKAGLIVMALTVPAAIAVGPAVAAGDCIELEESQSGDWCTGQLAALRVSVRNACSSPKRVGFTFALDREPIRAKTAGIVPAGDTFAKHVLLTLPPTTPAGLHTLTVTVTDAAGNASSKDSNVIVASCATP